MQTEASRANGRTEEALGERPEQAGRWGWEAARPQA